MSRFTTETYGLDTFRVCEITAGTPLDTVGLGMLLNNKIQGLCQVSDVKIDNKEYIRYNISSQISLRQLFISKTDKKRFLTVVRNILATIDGIQDYMLEPAMLLLELEEIYVNVGTLQTDLIYYPVLTEKRSFDVKQFLKDMIMGMEYDSTERDNYVTLLINYLNSKADITVAELRQYINQLLVGDTEASMQGGNNMLSKNPSPAPTLQKPNAFAQPVAPFEMNTGAQPVMQSQVPPMMPEQAQQPMMVQPAMQPQMQPMVSTPGFAVPGMEKQPVPTEPKKKKGFLFGKKEPKEKVKKEKPVKPAKPAKEPKPEKKAKKKNNDIVTPAGFVIPGMSNAKNSTLPEPPKPTGAPVLNSYQAVPQPAVQNPHQATPQMGGVQIPVQAVPQPEAVQSPYQAAPQPAVQNPYQATPQMGGVQTPFQAAPQPETVQNPFQTAPQPAMQNPYQATPQMGGVQSPFQAAPQPVAQNPYQVAPQNNYQMDNGENNVGETIVLHNDTAGETTVLCQGYNTLQKQNNPYLIRKRTNEKIEINKDVFKMGKEKSYVDYCVTGNSAISRSHADIIKKDREFYIVDNNSLNHTFVGKQQIPSQKMIKLEDFTTITLADELFEFRL